MNHLTETLKTEKVMEIINNYHFYIKHLAELNQEYYSNIMGGNISMYGIESAMPKASGGNNSDPVFNEIKRLIKTDKHIDRLEKKVRYIQNRWERITKEKHGVVFDQRLRGKTYLEIAAMLECSPQRVHAIQLEIAVLLTD